MPTNTASAKLMEVWSGRTQEERTSAPCKLPRHPQSRVYMVWQHFPFSSQTSKSSVSRDAGHADQETTTGKPGTGILWSQFEYDEIPYGVAPYEHGLDLLKAWHAVPSPDGELISIPMPAVGDLPRFQHLAFGDGRIYLSGKSTQWPLLVVRLRPQVLTLHCVSS